MFHIHAPGQQQSAGGSADATRHARAPTAPYSYACTCQLLQICCLVWCAVGHAATHWQPTSGCSGRPARRALSSHSAAATSLSYAWLPGRVGTTLCRSWPACSSLHGQHGRQPGTRQQLLHLRATFQTIHMRVIPRAKACSSVSRTYAYVAAAQQHSCNCHWLLCIHSSVRCAHLRMGQSSVVCMTVFKAHAFDCSRPPAAQSLQICSREETRQPGVK
jgi:hypothetical protein